MKTIFIALDLYTAWVRSSSAEQEQPNECYYPALAAFRRREPRLQSLATGSCQQARAGRRPANRRRSRLPPGRSRARPDFSAAARGSETFAVGARQRQLDSGPRKGQVGGRLGAQISEGVRGSPLPSSERRLLEPPAARLPRSSRGAEATRDDSSYGSAHASARRSFIDQREAISTSSGGCAGAAGRPVPD
jgi:hypothetical protein